MDYRGKSGIHIIITLSRSNFVTFPKYVTSQKKAYH